MATVSTYNYTPKPFMALLAVLMLIGMSYAGVIAALGNTRGIRFFGITFGSTITSMVLWVGVVAATYLSIKSLLSFINGLKGARTITLSDTTITSPKSVSSSTLVTVKIIDIHDMRDIWGQSKNSIQVS